MRVLITGGTGFIGSRLALRCLNLGYQVRIFSRASNDNEEQNSRDLKEAGVEVIMGSLTDPLAVSDAVADIHLVFHLAAAQHEANVADQVFWDVNLTGTRYLLDACVTASTNRFVYGSTIGVYGNLEGEIDELSPVRPDNIYGKTKFEAEKLVLQYKERLEVVAVRIAETYGPGDQRLLKLYKAINRGRFLRIGAGQNKHHLVYIDDLLDGLLLASSSLEAPGELFVLSGKDAPTTDDMIDTIGATLGRRTPGIHAPFSVFMLAAAVLETVLRPLGVQPPLHRRRMDFFRKSFTFSTRKASELLGFEPTIEFGLGAARTADWYKEKGLL